MKLRNKLLSLALVATVAATAVPTQIKASDKSNYKDYLGITALVSFVLGATYLEYRIRRLQEKLSHKLSTYAAVSVIAA